MDSLVIDNDSTEDEIINFDDLGEGSEIDLIIKTNPDIPKITFQNYEVQNSFLDIREEDKIVLQCDDNEYRYTLEVDITLEYAQLLLEINKEEGITVNNEDKAYKIIQQIELNRGRRYFSPNANEIMNIGIALFVFTINPLSIRIIFSNPKHPLMLARQSNEESPFLRLLRTDVIPFIADIDFTNHEISIRIEIMSDVCHYLSTLPNTEQRREYFVKHIFTYMVEEDKRTSYPGNHSLIEYFTISKKKYGVCPIFLHTMMDYAKTIPERMKYHTDKYIFAFREY